MKVNGNFDAEWTPEEWAAIQARYKRRAWLFPVMKASGEATGSRYLAEDPQPRRSFFAWFGDRFLY